MALLLAVRVLEIAPMVALIRGRIALRRSQTPRPRPGRDARRTSEIQAVLVVLMVL